MREIVPGAPPAEGVVPLAVPDIGGLEAELVEDSLRSGWIAYGPYVDRLEREVASLLGVEHAVAVSSGTAALHVALLLAGVRPDDEVLVSTFTFISPANAIRYVGAWPVFVDAEPDYWQLDPARAADFLQRECVTEGRELRNRVTGRRIGALLPVDVLGHPADLDAIRDLAGAYGLPVVEDAAEGLGALYRGKPVGSFGDVGCLSFNGNKIVTSGGGGMIVTDDGVLAERARYLVTQAKDDPLEYVHGDVGFNYRLSNLHAALGVAQLGRLPEFVAVKRRIASGYAEGLDGVPGLTLMPEADWADATYWLYTLLVDERRFGLSSRELMRRLIEADIQVRPGWQPMHQSPAHRDAQHRDCPVADNIHAQSLSLPCSVSLTGDQQARVIREIRRHAA